MTSYDAIVLGIGGIGSAALYELAHRGVRAVGIDRFHPPHGQGSTHGHTRVIRQAYFEHPNYVPLLLESYRLWRELELQVGRKLYHEVGLVEVGPSDGVIVPGVLRAASNYSLSIDRLSASEVSDTWPGLRVPASMDAVFERHAGFLLVEDCVQAHLDAAAAAGATILTNTVVQSWTADNNGVRLQTDHGTLEAARLVIAAGAWAPAMLPTAKLGAAGADRRPESERGLQLQVRRKSLFWFHSDTAEYDEATGFPVFFYEMPAGMFYGFPKIDARGVKVAQHTGGRTVDDPLNVDREIDPTEQQSLIDFLAACLPGVSPRVADHAVCLYTMSPDEHFILDRHPAHQNVVFVAGLSGHGFKFATALGAALADLALDGRSRMPIDFLSAARFAETA